MKAHALTTAYILLLISLGFIATDIYLPSLPAITAYFNASDSQVQMTLFFFLLSFAFTPLIFGPLSDHIGRKKTLYIGFGIGIAATLSCLIAPSIQWLIASRFLQGIGFGAIMIAARSTTSDFFTGKALARQMSLGTMLMPLILALAPTLGGILQENFQWRSVFIFLLLYMIPILAFVASRPESLKQFSDQKLTQLFSTYRSHLKQKQYLLYGINFILPSFGMFAYMTVSPFLFQDNLGLSPSEYGGLAIFIGGTILVTGYINLQLIRYFTLNQILCAGACLITLSGGLLLLFHFLDIFTQWSLMIPCMIFYTCIPLCIANSVSKAMSFIPRHFGAAAALLSSFQFLLGSLGSFIFSLIPDQSTLPLAVCFCAIGLLSLLNLRYLSSLQEIPSSPVTVPVLET